MKTEINLNESCWFLRLSLSRMGDKRGVDSNVVDADVDKAFVQVRKKLFKCHEFDAIRSLDSSIRHYVRAECLPFDPGVHLCPTLKVDLVDSEMKIFFEARTQLIEEFAAAWPDIVDRIAPGDLRSWFEKGDYQVEGVQDEFFMSWQFYAFAEPGKVAEVSPDVLTAHIRLMQERMREAVETIRVVQAETFAQLVGHLRERLDTDINGTPKRLSASTLRELQAWVTDFSSASNVTNFSELGRYVDQAKKLLSGVDIEELRSTDGLRARVRTELSHIEQSIDSSVINTPKRVIRRG